MLAFLELVLAVLLQFRMRPSGLWIIFVLGMKFTLVCVHGLFDEAYEFVPSHPNFWLLCFAMLAFWDGFAFGAMEAFDGVVDPSPV